MPDVKKYPEPLNGCDNGGWVVSGLLKLGIADGNSLSIIGIELGCNAFKPSGDTERASSGLCCAGIDALEVCVSGSVVKGISEVSVIGEQVEHVWITRRVFGAGVLNGRLLSNSV
jgi:hypothetical protein